MFIGSNIDWSMKCLWVCYMISERERKRESEGEKKKKRVVIYSIVD